MAKKVIRWFRAGRPLGWRKDMPIKKRRQIALKHRRGNYLATARALLALANVTKDKETKRKARADAKYFFALHKKKKRG
jgi:hypothetical protein